MLVLPAGGLTGGTGNDGWDHRPVPQTFLEPSDRIRFGDCGDDRGPARRVVSPG